MIATRVRSILESTQGELVHGVDSAMVDSVSTDTRSISHNGLFFALSGENFDAHDFLEKAITNGAGVLVVSRIPDLLDLSQFPDVTIIKVGDTLTALQDFSAWYRRELKVKVVGVTGSNGKTSTKDFTKAVLSVKFQVTATAGNFNNHIGLPLSILATEAHHEVCVWEMGMNHPGEIAPLCEIAQPDLGIITNVGTAHIEHMGSREAIAEEKGALAVSLPDEGSLIVPASCDYVKYFSKQTKAKLITVGGQGELRADQVSMNASGSSFKLVIKGEDPVKVRLNVTGEHMVENALLAAASGHVLGMSAAEIAQGLNGAVLTSGRLRNFVANGVTVLDDTYNANPESMAAALQTIAGIKTTGKRIVVLGHMAELGEHANQAHIEIGKLAAEKDLITISVGDQSMRIYEGVSESRGEGTHFSTKELAVEWLKENCLTGDIVLFKGSRSAGMDLVMNEVFQTQNNK